MRKRRGAALFALGILAPGVAVFGIAGLWLWLRPAQAEPTGRTSMGTETWTRSISACGSAASAAPIHRSICCASFDQEEGETDHA